MSHITEINPRRKRVKAPNKVNISLTSRDLEYTFFIERKFNVRYELEYPFTFSKTISKCIGYTHYYRQKIELNDYDSMQQVGIAKYRKSITLTDEDLIIEKILESWFSSFFQNRYPFTFSQTIGLCIRFTYFSLQDIKRL